MARVLSLFVLLLLGAGSLSITGCASGGGSGGGDDRPFNAMITRDTPFFLDGPDQQTPPNGTFRRGTRVRLLSRHGSHVKVEAIGGTTGFVSAMAVGPVDEGRQSWTGS